MGRNLTLLSEMTLFLTLLRSQWFPVIIRMTFNV